MKKIPMRMDALSRKRYLRSELARFVKRDGFLVFDPEGTMSGRGTYLHLYEESLALLAHSKFASRLPCPFQEGELEKAIGGIHHDGN